MREATRLLQRFCGKALAGTYRVSYIARRVAARSQPLVLSNGSADRRSARGSRCRPAMRNAYLRLHLLLQTHEEGVKVATTLKLTSPSLSRSPSR